MKKWVKWVLLGVVVAVIGTMTVMSMTAPLSVEATVLERQTLENSFTEKGTVIVPETQDIYSKNGGKLTAVHIKEEQPVSAGDLLFDFDVSDLENANTQMQSELKVLTSENAGTRVDITQAEKESERADNATRAQIMTLESQISSIESTLPALQAGLSQAESVVITHQRQVDDARRMYELGETSMQSVKDAEAAVNQAAKDVDRIRAQMDAVPVQVQAIRRQISDLQKGIGITSGLTGQRSASAREVYEARRDALMVKIEENNEKIEQAKIYASRAGTVSAVNFKAGQVAQPGDKLAEIFDHSERVIECHVLVEDIGEMAVGDPVKVTLKQRSADITFDSKIRKIANIAEESTSTLGLNERRVKVEIDAPGEALDTIGLGWPLDVKFVTSRAENCLSVPKTAVFQTERGFAVWRITDGKATAVEVKKGLETATSVELTGDLKPDDVVITDGADDKLSEGKGVAPIID